MNKTLLLLVGAVGLLLPALTLADTVRLKNGKVLTGMITEESASVVCITANGSEWVFSAKEVDSVERDAPVSVSAAKTKVKSAPGNGAAVTVIKLRGASRLGARPRGKGRPAELEVADDDPPPPAVSEKPRASAGPVTVYGTSWCPSCVKARAYFRSHGIPFADLDVDKDPSANAAYKAICKRNNLPSAVPVIDIGGQILQGFGESQVEEMLARR